MAYEFEPQVLLYTAFSGGSLVGEIAPGSGWKRSIRRDGGFWQGSATLTGDAGWLADLYASWLGRALIERSAALTWEGLTYELELEIEGDRRRRSLADMWNAVLTSYADGGVAAETAYATESLSIDRYGRKEERLMLDDYPLATAQAYRDSYLARNAWPWPRPVSLQPTGKTELVVRACGVIFTANWMFVEEGDGTDDDADDWLAEVIGSATGLSANHGGAVAGAGDCQFLKTGSLATNTLQVPKAPANPMRAWDVMQEIAALGDADGDPWQIWCDVGQVVHYQQVDLTPRYFLRNGKLYDSPGARDGVNPWTVRPAVVRNMDYPARGVEPGSMLSDARDTLVEEVEAGEGGTLTLRVGGEPAWVLAPEDEGE